MPKNKLSKEELLNDPELSEEAKIIEEGKKVVAEVEVEDEEEMDGEEEEEEMEESKKSVKEMEHGDEEEEEEEELKASYKEDLEVLVNSTEGLTEDFKDKAATIFEAAFTSKLREATEKLEEQYEQKLTEEVESVRNDLVEKVDSYLDYVVSEWIKENEVAIDSGLRTEITEDFMSALKTVFTEHYIEVPESKVDLFDTLEKESDKLSQELAESKSTVEDLKQQVETLSREKIIAEASENLATTQSVKLASLVEDIEFTDAATFAKKVETIKESYFSGKQEDKKELNERNDDIIESTKVIEEGKFEEELSPTMKKYSDSLSRLFKGN